VIARRIPLYKAASLVCMTASTRITARGDGSSYFKLATTGSTPRSIAVRAARRPRKSRAVRLQLRC
jgi:hypothetical protein